MKVYKFGGASIKSQEGVENLYSIVKEESTPLFVVVSAMGKTTNALEAVLELFMEYKTVEALEKLSSIEEYHSSIVAALWSGTSDSPHPTQSLFEKLREVILSSDKRDDYDRWYDRIVGYGELFSTSIISAYLAYRGLTNRWIDMRDCFVTDSRFREANINIDRSTRNLLSAMSGAPAQLFVGQGFIGATAGGDPTTLGREGSDYSAAMVGYILNAESVTIWKDVEGILNADPRIFNDTVHIPRLTYLDAIELSYSGAQVIHPKTIKPLQNKAIPLYVRPFADSTKPGTVIEGETPQLINVPIYIVKQNQILISIRPKDFSFVLEERLSEIFTVFAQYRQKINLIQSSAVNLSLCVDDSRYINRVVDTLQADFRVVYNKGVELLTIRGYDDEDYDRYAETEGVYLVQKTRRTVRVVRDKKES